jgi:hypothetical protein
MIKISSLFSHGVHIPFENAVKRSEEIRFSIFDSSYFFIDLLMIEK